MRAGLIAVPVNFKFPRVTIDLIIADSGAKLVFCDLERCLDAPQHLPLVEFGGRDGNAFDEFVDAGPFTAVTPGPREPAMFLYTSGSTGIPKAWCYRIKAICGWWAHGWPPISHGTAILLPRRSTT